MADNTNNQDTTNAQADNFNSGQPNEVGYEPEVEGGLSPVAIAKSRNIAMLVLLVFGAIVLIYYYFFVGDTGKPAEKPGARTTSQDSKTLAAQAVKPVTQDDPLPSVPSLPEPPPLVAPAPPPPPPAPELPKIEAPDLPQMPQPAAPMLQQKNAQGPAGPSADQRQKSSIMVSGGGGGGPAGSSTDPSLDPKNMSQSQKNQQANSAPFTTVAATPAQQIRATSLGDMTSLIAQGKVIEAVLETAVNTDLTGSVRAIVSRDVYAESGRRILIPRGARLIGTYAAKVSPGQTRVAIGWNRIINPNGLDLTLDGGDPLGSSVDNLGRAGVDGVLDNHYFEVMYNAVMLSTAQVAWSKGAEKLTKGGQKITSTTVAPDGTKSITDTGNATQQAIQSANSNIGNAVGQIAGQGMAAQPTITVDQGTSLKVFVNKDLVFPSLQATSHYIKVLR